MKVILFGATGMVGQGVLRECLEDDDVESVLVIGRHSVEKNRVVRDRGPRPAKLREIVTDDLQDLTPFKDELVGWDACCFCLGVSSAGMSEGAYREITFGLTMAVARTLARTSPGMTFMYVSGTGTDETGLGRSMWARVKGETENALLTLPFKAAYMFRPGFIQPLHGIVSKTALYRVVYAILIPLYPVLRLFPRFVTTTEIMGRAMLAAAKHGAPKTVLENSDINELGK